MSGLAAPTINLLILIGILFYYLREPVKSHVSTRHHTLRAELEKVRELLRQAKQQHEDFASKLTAIQAETNMLRDQMRQDAEAARQRLLSDAQRLSMTLSADAHAAAQSLYQELRSQLSSELGQRVIARAESLLRERLTGDDRARLRQEFSRQVETVQ